LGRILVILGLILCLSSSLQISSADRAAAAGDIVQTVRTILSKGSTDVGLARAKLTIDKLIDPSINIDANLREIDRLVGEIEKMAGPKASDAQKISAVRKVIYESGPWNDNRPFSYNMSDPDGIKLSNKLLPTYLRTRLGNCISMPMLFLILADRAGLNVTLSTAPRHVFVKYTDETGKIWNIETTSGANPARDEWIRQKGWFSDEARTNGVYLKTLSRQESIAVIADIALQGLGEQKRWEESIEVADAILEVYPQHVMAMVYRGSAYGRLLDRDFLRKYSQPIDIPADDYERYSFLAAQNNLAFAEAEALGWREADGKTMR